jgi:hypothetical protein
MDKQSVTAALEMAAPKIQGEGEQKAIREIISIGRKFEERWARIEVDPNLSEQGRKNALLGARQETESELATWTGQRIGTLDAAITSIAKAVDKEASPSLPADPSDSLGIKAALKESRKESRYAEIRRGLEDLDPLEVEALYFGSVSEEVREALESAPPRIRRSRDGGVFAEPWLTSEQIARQRVGRAAASNPELVSQLRGLQETRSSFSHFAAVLASGLRRVVPTGSAEIRLRDLDGRDVTPAKK